MDYAAIGERFIQFQNDIHNLLRLPEITAKPALMKYIDLDSSFDDSDSEKELFYNIDSGIDNTSNIDTSFAKEILDSDIDELFGAQGFVDVQFE